VLGAAWNCHCDGGACHRISNIRNRNAMTKTAREWLAMMEPQDAEQVQQWMTKAYTLDRKFDCISEMISNVTPQWQTLPGGFWEWRELYNKYAYLPSKMIGIYETDPYPSQSYSAPGIDPILYRPSRGGIRRDS
jgi:hypothetical protein